METFEQENGIYIYSKIEFSRILKYLCNPYLRSLSRFTYSPSHISRNVEDIYIDLVDALVKIRITSR